MSSSCKKNCFITECKGDAIVVCCCNELFICQDHFDDHHRNCDSKLYSISKYFEAMETKNSSQPEAKEILIKLKREIINRTEALVSSIHTESLLILEKLTKIFKSSQPSSQRIDFDLDFEFGKLFEKLIKIQNTDKKSFSNTSKTEDQHKGRQSSLFSPEVLKQQNLKLNSSTANNLISKNSLLSNSFHSTEQNQDWKFNIEDQDQLKLNLIKEQSEVISLKRSLEEREAALNTRRTQLYNLEMYLLAKQKDLDNTLDDLFNSANIDLKKKIVYINGIIDWRVRDATCLIKTVDKKFLFNCKLY